MSGSPVVGSGKTQSPPISTAASMSKPVSGSAASKTPKLVDRHGPPRGTGGESSVSISASTTSSSTLPVRFIAASGSPTWGVNRGWAGRPAWVVTSWENPVPTRKGATRLT
jgi:hypothetical protein